MSRRNTISLRSLSKEVKETVLVYLTEAGVQSFRESPYLREGGYLSCSKIIDDSHPHYLYVRARYYRHTSQIPEYALLALPHGSVAYMAREASPEHEEEKE